MVRLTPGCWLKTSVEFEPGEPSRLGAVITNHGWSDWSTQDLDAALGRDVAFRVTRRGADYLIEAAIAGEAGASSGWAGCRRTRAARSVPASMPAAPRRPASRPGSSA